MQLSIFYIWILVSRYNFYGAFGILDSIDGDVARLEKKKKYGSTIDSFAQIFLLNNFWYSFLYFFMKNLSYVMDINFILIFAFLISSLIIFYRLIS